MADPKKPAAQAAPAVGTSTKTDAEKAADAKKKAEERAAKLKELAPARVQRAITALYAVGKLGSYKPAPNQADALVAAVKGAYDACVASLKSGKATPAFTLPEVAADEKAK